MLPTLLNRHCDALDIPREARARWLREQLAKRGVKVAQRTPHNWLQPDWVRPHDKVRPHLPLILKLTKPQELALYRVISAGPECLEVPEVSPFDAAPARLSA